MVKGLRICLGNMKKAWAEQKEKIMVYAPENSKDSSGNNVREMMIGELVVVLVREQGVLQQRVCSKVTLMKKGMSAYSMFNDGELSYSTHYVGLNKGERYSHGLLVNAFSEVPVVDVSGIRDHISIETLRKAGLTQKLIKSVEDQKVKDYVLPYQNRRTVCSSSVIADNSKPLRQRF